MDSKNQQPSRSVRQALRLGGLAVALAAGVSVMASLPANARISAPLPSASPTASPTPTPTPGLPAAPSPAPSWTLIPSPAASIAPTPTPTPETEASPLPNGETPPPTPKPAYITQKGGPIKFTVLGTLSVGGQGNQTSYSGFNPLGSPSPSASPQNAIQALQNNNTSSSTQNAGMQAEVSRRTATTVTDVRVPLELREHRGRTDRDPGCLLLDPAIHDRLCRGADRAVRHQLPMGSTLRGFAFIYPTEFGDVTFFEGPATGAQSDIIDLYGVRARIVAGQTFYELGFSTRRRAGYRAVADADVRGGCLAREPQPDRRGCLAGAIGGDGSPTGPGGQIQVSDGTQSGDLTLTLRHLPEACVAYGAGEIFGDDYADFNGHRGSGAQDIGFDVSLERIGDSPGQLTTTRQESLLYGGSVGNGAFGLNLQQQSTFTPASDGNPANSYLSNQAGAQVSFNAFSVETSIIGQESRAIQQPGGVQSFRALGGTLQREFGRWNVSGSLFSQRTTTDTSSPITQTLVSAGVSHVFGRATITLTGTVTHTSSESSEAIQRLPLLTISRQISPVISAQVSGGYQTLTDRLNAASDGHSRVFNFQLNAPFSYGNGLTTGRSDPRLPATITGRVQFAAVGQGPVSGFTTAGASGGGLSNVQVILDDKYLQRTDLTGDFEFAFVAPGQHQLRIEGASIPRGLTVDQPVATITLSGGETTSVLFQVGNFGGILGKVIGLDASGNSIPLSNVSLRLTGGIFTQTDTTGTFGFGGLAPGTYPVEVIENTIPAFATFDANALTQKVQVHSGGYTKVTFSAKPLSSISGFVTYGLEMLPDLKGGVPNVYVVAEPGEHAAINTDDGSYVIDNLPEGDYTVSVDPETLPEGARRQAGKRSGPHRPRIGAGSRRFPRLAGLRRRSYSRSWVETRRLQRSRGFGRLVCRPTARPRSW